MTDFNSPAERNARMRARADYFRWLLKHYGSTEFVEMSDESDPVNLRQIFVPMRAGHENLSESEMAKPSEVAEQETEANLPGVDVFELIANKQLVCLSGLPGSGKTTLTKALIGELCGNHPSTLRSQLAGQTGIAPIPLILREIAGIDRIQTLAELMEAWWQNLERKAEQGDALDIARLRYSFSQEGEGYPLLLLFDGIDETGGQDVRQTILNIAVKANLNESNRVLVTGRPNGFDNLSVYHPMRLAGTDDPYEIKSIHTSSLLYYLLPLAWPQIQNFINRWYKLRPEWEIKRKEGSDHFLEALTDDNRPYLLTLARRPIFLTLMSLVHCTRNEMPHGRADLYEAIVDLYLNRQERHRQIQRGTNGQVLKVWPVQEKRRILGRIAYESQLRGADRQDDDDNPDQRRILWPQDELLGFIADFLQQRAGSGGIAPEEAAELLDYYLHPAGLLISPRAGEISFAHLSFQEYLCAEDIQRRLSGRQFEKIFQDDLAMRLTRPGWDEVGVLLLAIHKNRSDDGHLELLGLLQLQYAEQARLLVRALCGKELGIPPVRQQAWLPVLLAACLLHPNEGLASHLNGCPHLAETGLALVKALLNQQGDATAQWAILTKQVQTNDLPCCWVQQGLLAHWQQPNWQEQDGAASARLYRLLNVLELSRWGCQDNQQSPIADADLEQTLAKVLASDNKLLWRRDEDCVPIATNAGLMLDVLLPDSGLLLQHSLSAMPVDAWLLQGECFDDYFGEFFSQAGILLALYPKQLPPIRSRLSLGLYQLINLVEPLPLPELWLSRARSLFLSRWPQSQSQSQSRIRSLFLSRSRWRLLSLSLSWSRSAWRSLPCSRLLSESSLIYAPLRTQLKTCSEQNTIYGNSLDNYCLVLESFTYHLSAQDWFGEQAENPELMLSRGLQAGQPLPKALALFDERGMPLPQQARASWQELQRWVYDDNAVLDFYFPEGLSPEDEALLREDLAILKTQPWSPHAFVDAALQQWPESEPVKDFSFETAQAKMLAACEALLQAANTQ
ncbi:hypothetical protein JCM14076_28840 [Methylosoma difficile]